MNRILIVPIIVLIAVALVNATVFTYCCISYAEVLNDFTKCESDGGVDCHVERDGLSYNVYSL